MSHRIETEAITERELSLVSLSLLYHFFCFEPQKALINNMLNSDILNLWHSKWDMDIHETNTFLQNQDALERLQADHLAGNDSNLLIVFYVQIMPDDFVMQLHRF